VLIAGGADSWNELASAELYDPASATWTLTANLSNARADHSATMLPNGKVLIAGGIRKSFSLTSAELYDVGLDFDDSWRPEIASARFNNSLRLIGSLFQGVSQASGGNTQDSSTDYPVVQLRNIDSSQIALLPVDPRRGWSDTSFTSLRSRNVPAGPTLVTVFTNGIPSDSVYLVVPTSQQ
jgi:hypothetical protein